MELKQIDTINGTIIVVEVPEDAYDFFIHISSIMGRTVENKLTTFYKEDCFDLPNCWQMTYKILGKLSELSEEECTKFVEFKNISSPCQCEICGYDVDCYRDYVNQTDDDWENNPVADRLHTAKESFISLLQSHGVDISKNNILILEKL